MNSLGSTLAEAVERAARSEVRRGRGHTAPIEGGGQRPRSSPSMLGHERRHLVARTDAEADNAYCASATRGRGDRAMTSVSGPVLSAEDDRLAVIIPAQQVLGVVRCHRRRSGRRASCRRRRAASRPFRRLTPQKSQRRSQKARGPRPTRHAERRNRKKRPTRALASRQNGRGRPSMWRQESKRLVSRSGQSEAPAGRRWRECKVTRESKDSFYPRAG